MTGLPELAVFRPPSFPLEGELEVGVEGMEDGLWGMDTVPVPNESEYSTGSAYLPPVGTGEVAVARDRALPGVEKVPGGYDEVPATFTGFPLSLTGAACGLGLSAGRGSTTGMGTARNNTNTDVRKQKCVW